MKSMNFVLTIKAQMREGHNLIILNSSYTESVHSGTIVFKTTYLYTKLVLVFTWIKSLGKIPQSPVMQKQGIPKSTT